MKVSDLFAEIGFKVDSKGLSEFENSMKRIQKTIKSCISDVKEFAKAADQINRAFTSFSLANEDIRRRYNAITYAIRSQGKLNRAVASSTQSKSNTSVSASGSLGSLLGSSFSALPVIGAAIAAITGAIIGAFKVATAILKQGISQVLAYRDYRAFTGRSASGIADLLGMAKYTTHLKPEDILKDTANLEKSYWDMWFGGGNPEAYMRWGVMPTGNGQRDMRNILMAIAKQSGGNRGLMRAGLSQFGLSEDYMNILLNWDKMGQSDFLTYTDEQIKSIERVNENLNEFSNTLKQAIGAFVAALGDTDVLKEFFAWLGDLAKTVISAARQGAFQGKGTIRSAWTLGDILSADEGQRKKIQNGGWKDFETENSFMVSLLKGIGYTNPAAMPFMFANAMSGSGGQSVTINNNFDASGRTPEEIGDMTRSVFASEMQQFDTNNTTVMSGTMA